MNDEVIRAFSHFDGLGLRDVGIGRGLLQTLTPLPLVLPSPFPPLSFLCPPQLPWPSLWFGEGEPSD